MKKITENKRIGVKPKKLSLKGKQILVGGLVVMVAVAGYYRFSVGTLDMAKTEENAVPVMATADTEDYFAKAKKHPAKLQGALNLYFVCLLPNTKLRLLVSNVGE